MTNAAFIHDSPVAAVLLIGNELLSGRTRDVNLQQIAKELASIGIDVGECRVVADIQSQIVEALNQLREQYDYVFTTGGIGPTHDDITIDAVAAAFGVVAEEHPGAMSRLLERYKPEDLIPARRKMARSPCGATLVANDVTMIPGFRIENVFILAGVPSVCATMIKWIVANGELKSGRIVSEHTIPTNHRESDIATAIEQIENDFSSVSVGSYPRRENGVFSTRVVLRSRDIDDLERASAAVIIALDGVVAPDGVVIDEGGHKVLDGTSGSDA